MDNINLSFGVRPYVISIYTISIQMHTPLNNNHILYHRFINSLIISIYIIFEKSQMIPIRKTDNITNNKQSADQ